MGEKMTAAEYRELGRLARKAAWIQKDEGNDHNWDTLMGVDNWASRMGG